MKSIEALKWVRTNFSKKAFETFRNREKLETLINEAELKLNTDYFKKQFKSFIKDLKTSLSLLKDVTTGKYKPKSKKNIILLLLAFIYFLNPFDIVPDLLIGGFVDDAALFVWTLNNIRQELLNYSMSS